jgi:hypothetical protein
MSGDVPAPADTLLLRSFRHLVEEGTGLRFPARQEGDLRRGLDQARQALGLADLRQVPAGRAQGQRRGARFRVRFAADEGLFGM